jgi:tetratricopeptide (TPR) repeat protein
VGEQQALAELERASAHDRAGREAEAIPCYEEALRLGLDDDRAPEALLGLGSSLRNMGRLEESVEVLADACRRYPEHAALRMFLAISLASAGRDREALISTLDLARTRIDAPEVRRYTRALQEYTRELGAG